jgi:hypothetical protein
MVGVVEVDAVVDARRGAGHEQRAEDVDVLVRRAAAAVRRSLESAERRPLHREVAAAQRPPAVDPEPVVRQQPGELQVARLGPGASVGDPLVAARAVEPVVERQRLGEVRRERGPPFGCGAVVLLLAAVGGLAGSERAHERVARERPADALDGRAERRAWRLLVHACPHGEQRTTAADDVEVDRDHERRRRPSGQEVRGGPAVHLPPGLQDRARRRRVEPRTAGGVPRGAGPQRGARAVESGPRALDVVEEGVVAEAGEHAETALRSLETGRCRGVAARRVRVAHAAGDGASRVEAAHDLRRRRGRAEALAAVDVEDVLQSVREPVRDDRHREVQPPAVRGGPGEQVADVGRRVGDHGRRVEVVGGAHRRARDGEQGERRHHRGAGAACLAGHGVSPSGAPAPRSGS